MPRSPRRWSPSPSCRRVDSGSIQGLLDLRLQPLCLRLIHHGQSAAPAQHIVGIAGVFMADRMVDLCCAEWNHPAERNAIGGGGALDQSLGVQAVTSLQMSDLLVAPRGILEQGLQLQPLLFKPLCGAVGGLRRPDQGQGLGWAGAVQGAKAGQGLGRCRWLVQVAGAGGWCRWCRWLVQVAGAGGWRRWLVQVAGNLW